MLCDRLNKCRRRSSSGRGLEAWFVSPSPNVDGSSGEEDNDDGQGGARDGDDRSGSELEDQEGMGDDELVRRREEVFITVDEGEAGRDGDEGRREGRGDPLLMEVLPRHRLLVCFLLGVLMSHQCCRMTVPLLCSFSFHIGLLSSFLCFVWFVFALYVYYTLNIHSLSVHCQGCQIYMGYDTCGANSRAELKACTK